MIKYLPYGDNLVKIGPVDLDIALLKGSLTNKGRHAARAKKVTL